MTDLAITKVEHVWSKENDRWLYLEYDENGDIVGLNFMQGYDYDIFIMHYCNKYVGLTEFYNSMLVIFEAQDSCMTDLEFVNACIWAWIRAEDHKQD